MRICSALILTLILLLMVPTDGESASRGGRLGFGYSSYPVSGGFGGGNGDLATIRYSSYQFYFEGGFRMVDAGDTQLTFGSKVAMTPWEYRGIPFELGGSIAFVTDGTFNEDGEAATLIHLGFFTGFSALITDEVSVGAAVYPLSFGFGGAETVTDFFSPAFNIHFFF